MQRRLNIIFFSIFACMGWGMASICAAQTSNLPEGPVILTVTGAITQTNFDGEMRYDRTMLEALGTTIISTETPWTDAETTFTGILARDLLADVGATGRMVTGVALNQYSADIPSEDFERYDVILALKKNGEYLTVRDRGPLWIMYPWSDIPKLRTPLSVSRSIWQLYLLDVAPN